jgi:hypothetical protein
MSGYVSAAVVGSAVIGSLASSRASSAQSQAAGEATQAQRDIANEQVALQREQYLKNLELNAPFREAGLTAQNKLLGYLGLGAGDGRYARDFSMADYQADPGYAFRLSEGTKALDRTAAARGGLLSGAALKGAQRYGQDLASQEYQNAFNRYQTERAAQLNPLQSLAGVGQTAAGTLTNAYGAFGAQTANVVPNSVPDSSRHTCAPSAFHNCSWRPCEIKCKSSSPNVEWGLRKLAIIKSLLGRYGQLCRLVELDQVKHMYQATS